ncbi:hypothetical protein C4J85_2725 [Pseudomonas sp. R4-34-07]|uniref:hypothetical protein n=1 Tax=Pseudomonas sp. R4-34-07 TaxID=658642 RepID=UPI000F5778C2|nr:hypothetical protein [Pseudomonas sp. R4-34-07]AZF53210.1 hypothetical protein C4J85_2725 [Pseudomonas sp. R4-34-07]
MEFQVWQAIVVPLAIAFLTLLGTWLTNSASLSHQRTQRLRELLISGAWNKVHPMVLVLDVREAFGMRINLDPRALRLALAYQDRAFVVLRDYLSAREFVRVCEDGSRFQRTARANDDRNYRFWPALAALIGLILYTVLLLVYGYLSRHESVNAWLLLPISFMSFFVAVKVSVGLSAANRLFKLGPVIADGSGGVGASPSSRLSSSDPVAAAVPVPAAAVEVAEDASHRQSQGRADASLHCTPS